MTNNTTFTMDSSKLAEVVRLSGLNSETVTDTALRYDWQNADEHQEWLNEATAAEIAAWLRAVEVA